MAGTSDTLSGHGHLFPCTHEGQSFILSESSLCSHCLVLIEINFLFLSAPPGKDDFYESDTGDSSGSETDDEVCTCLRAHMCTCVCVRVSVFVRACL
jgi:hypothetical protein